MFLVCLYAGNLFSSAIACSTVKAVNYLRVDGSCSVCVLLRHSFLLQISARFFVNESKPFIVRNYSATQLYADKRMANPSVEAEVDTEMTARELSYVIEVAIYAFAMILGCGAFIYTARRLVSLPVIWK